jgi:hypothetical protein
MIEDLIKFADYLDKMGLYSEAEEIDRLIEKEAKKKKETKKDKCYYKVKARYDAWPSAYASGALVKCRQVGASNWGEGGSKKKKSKKK